MPGFLDRFRGPRLDPGDRMLLDQIRSSGADLSRPRETTHFLYFVREEGAREAGRRADELGYTVEVRPPIEGIDSWAVIAVRPTVLSERSISEARATLTELAEENAGEYDGWETEAGP
jgi:hypothetical protein